MEIASDVEYACISYDLFIFIVEITQLQYADVFLEEDVKQNGNDFYFCQNSVNDIWKSKSLWNVYKMISIHISITAIIRYFETVYWWKRL